MEISQWIVLEYVAGDMQLDKGIGAPPPNPCPTFVVKLMSVTELIENVENQGTLVHDEH
jgi:hypothetical protein